MPLYFLLNRKVSCLEAFIRVVYGNVDVKNFLCSAWAAKPYVLIFVKFLEEFNLYVEGIVRRQRPSINAFDFDFISFNRL